MPALENSPGEEAHWQVLQKRTYMNSKLKGRGLEVKDLYEDLKSGIVLYNFLEVLTGDSLRHYGKLNSGKLRIQQVANVNVVFKFFPDADIKLENIGVMDVVDGNPTSILGLIWSIIAFYLAREFGGKGGDLAAIKGKVLAWAKRKAKKHVAVTNLTDSFEDGRAFLAILNTTDNAGSPYEPAGESTENYRAAFEDAEAKYGVPQLLTWSDPSIYADEISMLTYLSEMMERLPESVPQPVLADPSELVGQFVDEHAAELVDDLERLCACESTPGNEKGRAAALTVVKELCAKAGLSEASLVYSEALGAVVASTKIQDPALPTVLLYATTGVPEGTLASSFTPVRKGPVLEAASARGDKANVVAPLMALRAIEAHVPAGERRCNVSVVVGASPSPTAVAAAIGTATALLPSAVDYVVVSNTKLRGASALYGSRGHVDVTVGVVAAAAAAAEVVKPLAAASVSGPLIDPATALCAKVAGLRTTKDAVSNLRLAALPSKDLDVLSRGGDDSEASSSPEALVHALQASAGSAALAAPEFALNAAAYAAEGKAPRCALFFQPSFSVLALRTTTTTTTMTGSHSISSPRRTMGRAEAAMPAAAYATVRAMVAPGYKDLERAAETVSVTIDASEPNFGFAVHRTDAPLAGAPGYLSDPKSPFAASLVASTRPDFFGCAASHSAVASALDAAIPKAAVYEVGVAGAGPDAVDTQALVDHTKNLAKLLYENFDKTMIPKNPPPLLPAFADQENISDAPPPSSRRIIIPGAAQLPPPPPASFSKPLVQKNTTATAPPTTKKNSSSSSSSTTTTTTTTTIEAPSSKNGPSSDAAASANNNQAVEARPAALARAESGRKGAVAAIKLGSAWSSQVEAGSARSRSQAAATFGGAPLRSSAVKFPAAATTPPTAATTTAATTTRTATTRSSQVLLPQRERPSLAQLVGDDARQALSAPAVAPRTSVEIPAASVEKKRPFFSGVVTTATSPVVVVEAPSAGNTATTTTAATTTTTTNNNTTSAVFEAARVAEEPPPLVAAKTDGSIIAVTAEDLVAELNRLRKAPSAYVATLERTVALYREDKSFWPEAEGAQPFLTHEGAAAVAEAIAFLRTYEGPPLKPLKVHRAMCSAASVHADDLATTGNRLGHTGSDGSKPAERLSRFGRWFERASECLAYRHSTAALLVSQLVVDDGMKSRTQRDTILSPDMRAVGAAVRKHPVHGTLAVITLAGGYGP